jgi:hypothetical protein
MNKTTATRTVVAVIITPANRDILPGTFGTTSSSAPNRHQCTRTRRAARRKFNEWPAAAGQRNSAHDHGLVRCVRRWDVRGRIALLPRHWRSIVVQRTALDVRQRREFSDGACGWSVRSRRVTASSRDKTTGRYMAPRRLPRSEPCNDQRQEG